MKLLAYSVRDEAVQAFLPPFYVRHLGEAIRSFSDAALDAQHQFYKHRSHYVLYAVGSFDDASGLFQSAEPVRVISALECHSPEELPKAS